MRKQPYPYDQDFHLWVKEQASALKARQFTRLDYDNLIEEIEDMGKSEKRSLESYLERLIEHILKLQYWRATPRIKNAPGNARALESEKKQNYKHWQVEIANFRNRIKRLLKRSPSLKNYMAEVYPEIYADAVSSWQIEFDIPDSEPIPLKKILEPDFFGE